MISKNYRQNKEEVLKLYEQYTGFCKEYGENIDLSIQGQAEKIKNEVFNLMVLGEAKSGKSTFINAFLGDEVVPMDVRQCTSAIIEIKRGSKFELTAYKAGGGKVLIADRGRINEFLRKNAAIADEYRTIPVTTINNELLIKFKDAEISTLVRGNFIKNHAKDNIFNLNQEEYNRQINKYITENCKKWRDIITRIEITYPLSEEMQGITIIDSPGVGAGGNVGSIAEQYVSNANAIIFVKSLNGQALESSSFMNFMRTTCPGRQKETLFLVLTGKGNLEDINYKSLMEQAVQMYGNDVKKEKIIGVDSKAELMANKCRKLGTAEKIDDFFDELDNNKNDYPPVSNAWLRSRGKLEKFYQKTEDISNFDKVRAAIEKFAKAANYLQLIKLLESMEKEYRNNHKRLQELIQTNKATLNDPEALEKQIAEKKKELDDVYVKIRAGIDEIRIKYTDELGGEGIIQAEAEKQRKKYEEKIRKFKNLSAADETTVKELKKVTMDTIDDTKKFRKKIGDQVIQECNEKLVRYTEAASKIPAANFEPHFSEEDFDNWSGYAKAKSTEVDEIETGWTFKKVEKTPHYYAEKHVNILVDNICGRLKSNIIPSMKKDVMNYVDGCCDVYKERLQGQYDRLTSEYNRLLDLKNDNEKRLRDIKIKEEQVGKIEKELDLTGELEKEIRNYVE